MRTLYLLFSFIILLTSLVNNVTHANETVTKELIHEICSHTRNTEVCHETLASLEGKALQPNPLATLATKARKTAVDQAFATLHKLWSLYLSIKDNNPRKSQQTLKKLYEMCHVKYSDVKENLANAVVPMKEGNRHAMKQHIVQAMNQASACSDALVGVPSTVPHEIRELKDLLSILLAICDKVAHL